MEYAATVWNPYSIIDANKQERIQRQAARVITGYYKTKEDGCVTDMLAKLELEELKARRTS